MTIKRFLNQKKGFSLVEVLVALAILSLIVFAFTALFTDSFSRIFAMGRRNQALFNAQVLVEREIRSPSVTLPEGVNSAPLALTITIPNSPQVTVNGNIVETQIEGTNAFLTTFIPQ